MNLLDGTTEFMLKAKQLDAPPSFDDYPLRKLRSKLLAEEWAEYIKAEMEDDLVETVDGLLDIIVIAWGSLLAYVGPDRANACAAEVIRSNLDKVDGPGLPIFREDGKVIKPEGWLPPQIKAVLFPG